MYIKKGFLLWHTQGHELLNNVLFVSILLKYKHLEKTRVQHVEKKNASIFTKAAGATRSTERSRDFSMTTTALLYCIVINAGVKSKECLAVCGAQKQSMCFATMHAEGNSEHWLTERNISAAYVKNRFSEYIPADMVQFLCAVICAG